MTREAPSTNSPPSLDHWLAISTGQLLDAFSLPLGAGASHARRAIFEAINRGRHRRQHKPTLASVAKQASKAAIPVARYEIKPDGTVVVVTGQPESASSENPWLADLHKVTTQ